MSNCIRTQAQGTFLAIDRTSLQDVVTQTLTKLGFEFGQRSAQRGVASTMGAGLRTRDEYALGYSVPGPHGEDMRAMLRVLDSSVPGYAFRVQLGVFRLVCLNGMYGFGSAFEQRVTHRVGPLATSKLDALPAAIEAALQGLPALAEAASDLAAIEVPDAIQVIAHLNVPGIVKEHAMRLVSRGNFRAEDTPTNAWGLYNLVNEIDRLLARRGSSAYLERDERLADDVACLALNQIAA